MCSSCNKMLILALMASLFAAGGCDRREQQRCRMANEYVVARTGGAPRSLEVLRLDRNRVAVFWSADQHVFYAMIDNEGVPLSTPKKVEKKDIAADDAKTYWRHQSQPILDAVSLSPVRISEDKVALAMLCHQGQSAALVAVAMIDVRNHHPVLWLKQVGETGLFTKRVSLTTVNNRLLVGWQDTRSDPQSIELTALDVKSGKLTRQSKIAAKTAVYGPALQRNGQSALVLWSETRDDGKKARLMSAVPGDDLALKHRQQLDTLELFDAEPNLVPWKNGFATVFRDNRDDDHTEEFYFTILDKTGAKTQPSKRISRADGPEGPKLSAGKSFFFSSAVRSYNNNFLVGFNRFDAAGTKTGGEFQVYADKCDFIRAGLETDGDKAILVYGENADTGGRILAATISCNGR